MSSSHHVTFASTPDAPRSPLSSLLPPADAPPDAPLIASAVVTPPRLPLRVRLAYSLGHFYNDLCAAMWFSYLLVYFQYLLKFESELAGYLLLLGQIVDAVATPVIGLESDQTAGFCGYGKRKSWHLLGTVFVSLSFPFLFLHCLGCAHAPHWAQFIYYAPFVTAFQIGWASVQIAHLSIVNQLTSNESERVQLYSWRNANTLLASIVVYGVAWALLGVSGDKQWSYSDLISFMILMLTVVGLGLGFSTLYHLGVPEAHDTAPRGIHPPHPSGGLSAYELAERSSSMEWRDWLKEWQFYLVAALYMLSRLVFNLTQTYWPIYLTESLLLSKQFIAIIPMVICVAGFFASLGMRALNRALGRKPTFALGILIAGVSFGWMWFLKAHSMLVFGPALLFGVGGNTLIISSLSMAADMIGNNVRSSAFVYGVMSLTDKLSSGTAVMLVQYLKPGCVSNDEEAVCRAVHAHFFKCVMVFLPLGCLLVCLCVLLLVAPIKLGPLHKCTADALVVHPVQTSNGADHLHVHETSPLLWPSQSDAAMPGSYGSGVIHRESDSAKR